MSWPKKTWTQDGWVDFKTPGRGAPKGLPDDWKEHKSSIDNSSYWDVINNPLYEAAANASGLDWDQWVADSIEAIGDEAEYGSNEYVRVQTKGGYRTTKKEGGFNEHEAEYDVMTRQEAYDEGYTDEDIAAGSGEPVDQPDSDLMNWGIDRGKHGAVAEDLDTMHSWLGKTIKTHSLQDSPIINRGPEGSDYGIDGDIWEHYGLDKPPAPVKEMDIDYKFNLLDLKTSTATYDKPGGNSPHLAGYPTLDLSTADDTYTEVSYDEMAGDAMEGTHYEDYQRWEGQDTREAEHAYEHTSYGETVSKSTDKMNDGQGATPKQLNIRKYTRQVKEILGKKHDHKAWQDFANVKTINSENDVKKIEKAFQEHGGVLPD